MSLSQQHSEALVFNDASCCSSTSRTTFMLWCSSFVLLSGEAAKTKTLDDVWCFFLPLFNIELIYLFHRLNEIWRMVWLKSEGWKHSLLVAIHIEIWINCQPWMALKNWLCQMILSFKLLKINKYWHYIWQSGTEQGFTKADFICKRTDSISAILGFFQRLVKDFRLHISKRQCF